ncbi:interleukin-18 receptor 1 isoform X3 [Sturnira hondurensis]|uniref:interleukin-18 receptor 1 isoform X3 n=1 Tax=Sturnira hondurensis TaxID=192404 RepID=UPI00187A72A3|nr:interleukin-18 receptor 1 isoform X3 [Sturnira hondurensis]
MHCGQLLLTLLVFMFISTSETCTLRPHITAVEGEPFYLKYCLSSSEHENEPATIKWYKSNESHGLVELSSSSSPRIALHDYVLEFWPVQLDDSGSYFFQMGNDTHEWRLNVIRRSKHSCFAEKQVISITVEVKQALQIPCDEHSYYKKLVNRTLLYKNCEKIEKNKNPSFRKNAELNDRGYYTCMFFLYHNGKLFNVTNTFNITIVGDHSNIIPVLLGPKLNHVGVELGKDVQLNCSALLNEKDLIYWNIQKENGENPNVHEEKEIRIKTAEGKWHASKILRIENIDEINLNFLYNCTVASEDDIDTKSFILLKKAELVDIPGHVFTRGIIIAVLILGVAVCLMIVAVIYRVDLALFYRHFMGRDETLTAVVDEIHSLIEQSRRLIIVLSKSYMSNEVRYELESGLHEALVERKIKIILIEFTPIGDFTFLPQSLKLLKSHRVLKWKADKSLSYKSRFWKNLLYLMPAKTVKPWRDESEVFPMLSQSRSSERLNVIKNS